MKPPILAVCLVAFCFGCGKPPAANRPAVYKVSGTVTHKGTAVEGASVRFVKTDGKSGASGITDSQGKFTLTTHEAGDGAQTGDYLVGISKVDLGKVDVGHGSPGDKDYRPPSGNAPPPPKNLLPAQYAEPTPTGLKATVKAEGPNDFAFDLK